jgi:hypothetical protein
MSSWVLPLQRSTGPNQLLPPALVRRYEVLIQPRSDVKQLRMREVQSASIGHLVTVRVRMQTHPITHLPAPAWAV